MKQVEGMGRSGRRVRRECTKKGRRFRRAAPGRTKAGRYREEPKGRNRGEGVAFQSWIKIRRTHDVLDPQHPVSSLQSAVCSL